MPERMRWEEEWTCPVHDGPRYCEYASDLWTEPGETCLDCMFATWAPRKDADGWTIPDNRPILVWRGMLEDISLDSLKAQLNRPSILLDTLREQHDGKSNVAIT